MQVRLFMLSVVAELVMAVQAVAEVEEFVMLLHNQLQQVFLTQLQLVLVLQEQMLVQQT